jgi:hypothetical protein
VTAAQTIAARGRGDVGQEDDLLVRELIRDESHVRLRVSYEQILRLRPVDRVPEPPAAERLAIIAMLHCE